MFIDVFEELCKQKGISASKACDEVGLSRSTFSHWKKQRQSGIAVQPDTATVKKIALFFEVPMSLLLEQDTTDSLVPWLQQSEPNGRLHDAPALFSDPVLTDKELLIIDAYRRNPDAQKFVDRVLGLADESDK